MSTVKSVADRLTEIQKMKQQFLEDVNKELRLIGHDFRFNKYDVELFDFDEKGRVIGLSILPIHFQYYEGYELGQTLFDWQIEDVLELVKEQGEDVLYHFSDGLQQKSFLYRIDYTKVPLFISVFKHLKRLYIEREEFCKIPVHVFDLPNLEEIEINHTYCDVPIEIPEEIGRLKSLKKLSIRNNSARGHNISMVGISDAISMEELILPGLEISSIPSSFGNLKNLKILNLNGNRIENLPKSIGKLINLQKLYLGTNKLSRVPESIGDLTSLQELSLYSNNLKEIPESISKLSELRFIIVLSNNRIQRLPENLSQLAINFEI